MIKLKEILNGTLLFLNEDEEDDFLKHHYTGYIGSDAYKQYGEKGGLSWLGKKSKYPILLDKKKMGEFDVEFRQTGERNVYCKRMDNNEDYVRDQEGNLVKLTPNEVNEKGYPEFDTTVVAFIDDIPIGLVSDEFGAVGVWVEGSYQNRGIGTELLEKHIEQRPKVKSGQSKIGQMTHSGQLMTRKYFRKMATKHGKDWFEKLRVK